MQVEDDKQSVEMSYASKKDSFVHGKLNNFISLFGIYSAYGFY